MFKLIKNSSSFFILMMAITLYGCGSEETSQFKEIPLNDKSSLSTLTLEAFPFPIPPAPGSCPLEDPSHLKAKIVDLKGPDSFGWEPGEGFEGIDVRWHDNSDGETSYLIYFFDTAPLTPGLGAFLPRNTDRITKAMKIGKTFEIKVKAIRQAPDGTFECASDFSNTATVTVEEKLDD